MAFSQLLLSSCEFFSYWSLSELTIPNSFHTSCLLLELLVVWNGSDQMLKSVWQKTSPSFLQISLVRTNWQNSLGKY